MAELLHGAIQLLMEDKPVGLIMVETVVLVVGLVAMMTFHQIMLAQMVEKTVPMDITQVILPERLEQDSVRLQDDLENRLMFYTQVAAVELHVPEEQRNREEPEELGAVVTEMAQRIRQVKAVQLIPAAVEAAEIILEKEMIHTQNILVVQDWYMSDGAIKRKEKLCIIKEFSLR